MKTKQDKNVSRRRFIITSATAAVGMTLLPSMSAFKTRQSLMTRSFGRLNHEVTTFGMGGQASIQWTPDDVDPVAIILKAFDKKINYFDTSNLYGPSQMNYGRAFRKIGLIPGLTGYNEGLRKSIFLTSKTHIRIAKGDLKVEGVGNWTNGESGSHTIDDVKRSLSQIFGNGKGFYPEGAYLDMVLLHSINNKAEVDAAYEGLYDTDSKAERIGALAALRDYRDGTNLTGLNPKEEKLIRHIGFSGHYDAGVMMDLIQRDRDNLVEGMLVAINANDKLNFNMQNNVIPVAAAKNMGIIGMKVFADGAMYTKGAHWSNQPSHVVRQVGSSDLPFRPLIEYSLTTPGINTLIIGIGQISDNPQECQLTQNIEAAQIKPDGLSEADRESVEQATARVKEGKTNYFQIEKGGLTAARNVKTGKAGSQHIRITWDTAFAGSSPIETYEIWRNDTKAGEVKHIPQTTQQPFAFEAPVADTGKNEYKVVTVDRKGNRAETEKIKVI
ncbi:MAG: aldo/keto reductase [Bacteroidales bacterium]|nr:aldo/keto reductase [Bacteroidales bacterium]MBN2764401.1 aldo/keto reductase [Bacteroidales bacterium]